MPTVQLSTRDVKAALEHNAEFFIQFFLGDELTKPVPEFHKEIFYDMTSVVDPRLAIAIPRDHAKTTLAKLAVLWYFLFTDFRFIIYVSATIDVAIPSVNDIISFLESENFVATFGPVQWVTKQDGKGLYKFYIGDKLCILRAFGAGKQIRGINVDNQRPQLAIVDDLEDNNTIATEDLFLKMKRWVYGPFMKALDKFNNKIIWLGNMTSRKSNLWEICHSEFWTSKLFGCILENGQPLWPDAWPLEKLKQDFAMYQKAGMADVWFAEMMNMPLVSGGIIKANEIQYAPAVYPPDVEYAFITVDLAISKNTTAHDTTISVHANNGTKLQLVQVEGGKGIDPIQLFNALIQLAFKWNVSCIGIESVAYQASLQYVYPYMCLEQGIEGITFVPLEAKGRKIERIITWAGLIKKGEYVLTEGDFVITDQLLRYDPKQAKNDDDYIDGAAYVSQMTQRYMIEILACKERTIISKPLSGYQLSHV